LQKSYETKFFNNENIYYVKKEIKYNEIFKINRDQTTNIKLEKEEEKDIFIENKNSILFPVGGKMEKSFEETLMASAMDFEFDDSFNDLLDIDESDSNFGKFMLENENLFLFDEEFERTQYLTKEVYPTKGPEVKVSDIFITKPIFNSKKEKKEGAGYMLTKLKNEESIYVQQQFFRKEIERTMNYISLSNFVENLKYVTQILEDQIQNNKYDQIENSLLFLYKLLCKTFILSKASELDTKTFIVEKGLITFCLVVENKYTEEQIKKLVDRNIILDHYTIEGKNILKVKCTEAVYQKQYEKDIKSGVDTKISLFLSNIVNKQLMNYYSVLTSKSEELFDDLLKQ